MNYIFCPRLGLDALYVFKKKSLETTIFTVGPAKEKFEASLFKPDTFLVSTDDYNCKHDNWFILDCSRITFLVHNKVTMHAI